MGVTTSRFADGENDGVPDGSSSEVRPSKTQSLQDVLEMSGAILLSPIAPDYFFTQ